MEGGGVVAVVWISGTGGGVVDIKLDACWLLACGGGDDSVIRTSLWFCTVLGGEAVTDNSPFSLFKGEAEDDDCGGGGC